MATHKVDYKKIYDYLATMKGHVVTASGIAHFTGHEHIYGGTMTKLVRDGYLEKCELKGYYRIIHR